MNAPIPLVRPWLPSLDDISADLREILESGRLTNFGPYSQRLEREAAALLGVRHAAAISSATTALCLLLETLPEETEVVVPSFTFVATVQAIVWNGLTPVFADIDPETLNVDPQSVERCLTPRTSAILGVHAFGVPCDVDALTAIAREHHVKLFFDAAHAFGSRRNGVLAGGFGDAEVFSLSATKVVPSGEGGLVTTNDDRIHRAILDRRNYGLRHDGSRDCANAGLNGKLPEFNALLALKEIESLDWRLARRNELARRYHDALGAVPGIRFQTLPDGDLTTWKDLTIQLDASVFGADRNAVRAALAAQKIETAPYFWPPVHRMTYFRSCRTDELTVTDRVAERILSLPLFEALADEDVDRVCAVVQGMRQARANHPAA